MKLQLVGFLDGRAIGWGRVLLRAFVLWLAVPDRDRPADHAGLLVLHPRKQGWHDLAVNSVVIKERMLAPPKSAISAAPAQQPMPAPAPSRPSATPVGSAPVYGPQSYGQLRTTARLRVEPERPTAGRPADGGPAAAGSGPAADPAARDGRLPRTGSRVRTRPAPPPPRYRRPAPRVRRTGAAARHAGWPAGRVRLVGRAGRRPPAHHRRSGAARSQSAAAAGRGGRPVGEAVGRDPHGVEVPSGDRRWTRPGST